MQRKNLIPILLCLISLVALSSCTDDAPMPDASPEGELHIEAILKGYSGADTRTVDVDYSTRFAKGDKMGILAIRNGQVMSEVCNIRATYSGDRWTADSKLRQYNGATFVAYYPYKSDLNTSLITCAEDLKAQLDIPEKGTYDAEEYKAHDWLIASEGTVSEGVLTFTFTHAYPMLEIILPRTVYYMTQKGNTSTLSNYYIRQAEYYYISDAQYKMCETSPNAYRCLVPPDEDVIVWGGYLDADKKEHDFGYTLKAHTLKAGECRSVVVDQQTVVYFNYSQGDYFLADGNLVEKDKGLTEEQQEQCIGVVFYTNSSSVSMGSAEKEALTEIGVAPHGYVVALRDAYDPTTGATIANKMWGPSIDIEDLDNINDIESYLTDYSGLDKTQAMAATSLGKDYTNYVTYGIDLFAQQVPAPSHTTGWFLPSAGQWIHMLSKLGGVSLSSSDFTVHSWSTKQVSCHYEYTGDEYTKLNNKFKDSGTYDAVEGAFWTSNELGISDAAYVYFSTSAFDIYECHKGDAWKKIRCFLAF